MIGVLIVVGLVITVIFSTVLGLRNSEIRVLKATIADKNYEIHRLKVEFEAALKHTKAAVQDKQSAQNLESIIHGLVIDSFNDCLGKYALSGEETQ